FFQAEDGIRDFHVTGVQTCALPILRTGLPPHEAWERTVGRLVAAAPGAATAAAPAAATAAAGRDGTDLPAALLRLAEHCAGDPRSEERRVGKECRDRGSRHSGEKER